MANTKEITIDENGDWTKIANPSEKGFVSNEGYVTLLFREDPDSVSPQAVSGHKLEQRHDFGYYFSLSAGQALYCRTTTSSDKGKVAVTLED